MKHTIDDLKALQAMNLESKIVITQARIREWVELMGQDTDRERKESQSGRIRGV